MPYSTSMKMWFLFNVVVFSAVVFSKSIGKHEEGNAEKLRTAHERFEDEHYADGKHNPEKDHEAILGSHKAAEEFDQLSPEESKRRLKVLAGRMDRAGNANGAIDKEELTNWIFDSLQKLDEEEARERFPEIDKNKDGHISWEEYKKENFAEDDENDEDVKKFIAEDHQYFDAADRNQDNQLNPVEFSAFQRPENHEHMQQAMIAITLREKDANKDGQLDFKEFMKDIDQKEEEEWWNVEKERFENEYDSNKDGLLDKDEIKAWLAPDVKSSAREEADHIFHETDENKDKKLSFDEIVGKHELWVGSEATGYGKHLEDIKHTEDL